MPLNCLRDASMIGRRGGSPGHTDVLSGVRMSAPASRRLVLAALATACLPLAAQTFTRDQLEQQYRITCSAQNLATSPFLRPQCAQWRAQIDRMAADGSPLDDEEDQGVPARPAPSAPGGVIGDPGMLSRERVYDDQCVRKVPRTDAERAQCQRLYQMINPATNRGPAGAATGARGSDGMTGAGGGTPVDQHGRACISLVERKVERWGTNQENTTLSYFFRNGCNQSMQVSGQVSHNDGPERGSAIAVCPGRTEKLVCLGFGGGKGCASMTGYRVQPAPALTDSCR
jgi:hypothetical protein